MTTTPQDLLTAVARGIADGASVDDRRAGRQACILLASALGEPGESMGPQNNAAPAGAPRIDGGQLLDLAIVKMRAFLAELETKNTPAPTSTSTSTSTSTARNAGGSSSTATAAPAAPPATSTPRPRPPGLRIPIVGGYARRR